MKTAQIITANKEIVDELLAMNTNNRPLRPTIVKLYTDLIEQGKWMLTNNGIGVSSSNVLIDGQHRLHAIRAANYPPVKLLLVTGLDMESQIVVDQQAKRSARDALRLIFDIRVSKNAPAICNIILKDRRKWANYTISIMQTVDILREHENEIESVCNVPKNMTSFPAPVLAAMVVVLKNGKANIENIRTFLWKVETGENLDRTSPALLLRNYLQSGNKSSSGGVMQKERFFKTLNAFYKFIANEKTDKLYAKDPR
jgi:hypothetical protein